MVDDVSTPQLNYLRVMLNSVCHRRWRKKEILELVGKEPKWATPNRLMR